MRGTDLNTSRRKLQEMATRLRREGGDTARQVLQPAGGEGSGGLSNAPLHLADLGTDNAEKEMSVSLLETQSRILEQVEDAFARIDAGTYGICQECGKPIRSERLEAIPYAAHCIACARQLEGS